VTKLWPVVVLVLVTGGCARLAQNITARGAAARMLPRFATCPNDGEAVRLLIDRRCPGSVCGYSCLPGRWDLILILQPKETP
jgi:hypothetical protein